MADSPVYESRLTSNTRYTAQVVSNNQVKFTRNNRDGETTLWVPLDLIWQVVRDKFRERLHQRMEHLFLKDFFL